MTPLTILLSLTVTLGSLPHLAQAEPPEPTAESTFDHSSWAAVLAECVSPEGRFAYDRLLNSATLTARFDDYIASIATANVNRLNGKEQLAFWINAYNASVVKGVLEHYPVGSVLDLEGFFDRGAHTVAGLALSLNDMENERIRRAFEEPRIHFALNCASMSCPPLLAEPFTGHHLDAQLEEQATRFLAATTEVSTNEMEIRLNRILEWFGRDFDDVGGVREFVARRVPEAEAVRNERNIIVFHEYDWALNVP